MKNKLYNYVLTKRPNTKYEDVVIMDENDDYLYFGIVGLRGILRCEKENLEQAENPE
jgi:hypothetical protein